MCEFPNVLHGEVERESTRCVDFIEVGSIERVGLHDSRARLWACGGTTLIVVAVKNGAFTCWSIALPVGSRVL